MEIGFISREAAWKLAVNLWRNDKTVSGGIPDYNVFRPARIWSKVALAATPVATNNFFQTPTGFFGNHDGLNKLGSYYFIAHDARVVVHEAAGVIATLANIQTLIANSYLHLEVDARPIINREPLYAYAKGTGVEDIGALVAAFAVLGKDSASRHHDLIPYMPDQTIKAWLEVDTATVGTLTDEYKVTLWLYGWQFKSQAAA